MVPSVICLDCGLGSLPADCEISGHQRCCREYLHLLGYLTMKVPKFSKELTETESWCKQVKKKQDSKCANNVTLMWTQGSSEWVIQCNLLGSQCMLFKIVQAMCIQISYKTSLLLLRQVTDCLYSYVEDDLVLVKFVFHI